MSRKRRLTHAEYMRGVDEAGARAQAKLDARDAAPAPLPERRTPRGRTSRGPSVPLRARVDHRPAPEVTPTAPTTIRVELTAAELDLLVSALDSHEYWELTDAECRNHGASQIADGESEEIDAGRALVRKLTQAAIGGPR